MVSNNYEIVIASENVEVIHKRTTGKYKPGNVV
jgi:hypothetical protein